VTRRLAVTVVALSVAPLGLAAASAAVTAARSTRSRCSPRWRAVVRAPAMFFGVAALSQDDVWAAGYEGPQKTSTPVVAHWDGRKLHVVQPFQESRRGGALTSIAATAPDDVWAVGADGSGNAVALHWDGTAWAMVPTPQRGEFLSDVAAVASDDVWAVGGWSGGRRKGSSRPFTMHWDGQRWRVVEVGGEIGSTPADLAAVDGRAADDVWAVGENTDDPYTSFGFLDVVLHWDGQTWSQVASPLADEMGSGPVAEAVSVAPDSEVWTLNYDYSGNGPDFVHWSGRNRRVAKVNAPGFLDDPNGDIEAWLDNVAAVSRKSVWAVGDWETSGSRRYVDHPLVAWWNGRSWRREHPPLDRIRDASLVDLSVVSPHEVWAAGDHLVARYGC
jgi:hypothetical protein